MGEEHAGRCYRYDLLIMMVRYLGLNDKSDKKGEYICYEIFNSSTNL